MGTLRRIIVRPEKKTQDLFLWMSERKRKSLIHAQNSTNEQTAVA